MRKQRQAVDRTMGRIVITSSATAHAPEHDLPVYGASKLAVNPHPQLAKTENSQRTDR